MTDFVADTFSEDQLDSLVSVAIQRAEELDDLGVPSQDAWREVMTYEERLAELTSPSEIAGGIARAGAVRAALAAGMRAHAERLAGKYLAEESLPAERRTAIERAFREAAAKNGTATGDLTKTAAQYDLRTHRFMGRRISALLGIVAILGLALVLLWRVYLHHERAFHPEEPTLVSIFGRAA